MPIPHFAPKLTAKVLVTPEGFLGYMRKKKLLPTTPPPEAAIICFHGGLFKWAKDHHRLQRCDGFCHFLHYFPETNGQIAITQRFGIGAPAAAVVMEELIAWGVKKFVIIGFAGSLNAKIDIGDTVLCSKALRDEGTSFHYLPDSAYCEPSKPLTEKLAAYLTAHAVPFHHGPTWTTDAPYRETTDEAKFYQEQGVLTVEMEASALFAVGQFRKVDVAALFCVSDTLAELEWRPEFHNEKPNVGLENILTATVKALST